MPVNQLVAAEFQEAALEVQIVRSNQRDLRGRCCLQLLYYGNVAQTDVLAQLGANPSRRLPMNLIRKLHPSRLIQDDGPPNVIADEQDVTVPAGNPGDTITVTFAIDQRDMPVGQVVCFDFSDNTLPVAVPPEQ